MIGQGHIVLKQMFTKLAGLPEKYWATFDIEELDNQARDFEGFTEKSLINSCDFFMEIICGSCPGNYQLGRIRRL